MAAKRRPKYTAADFPEPGSVFVAPMPDGRLVAGRVLRCEFEGGAQAALVASSPWIGTSDPPLNEPLLRETALLTHHAWKADPDLFWAWDLLPAEFRVIGRIELTADERQTQCKSYSGWQRVPLQAWLQWRWDHDREALLAEEARNEAEEKERRRVAAERRAAYMQTLTLDLLAERQWFENWDDDENVVQVNAVRDVFVRLVADLRSEPSPKRAVTEKRFKLAIKELNKIDAAGDGIMTIEREDICEALEQVACAAKQPALSTYVDKMRDW